MLCMLSEYVFGYRFYARMKLVEPLDLAQKYESRSVGTSKEYQIILRAMHHLSPENGGTEYNPIITCICMYAIVPCNVIQLPGNIF